jgi:hypothetical protein
MRLAIVAGQSRLDHLQHKKADRYGLLFYVVRQRKGIDLFFNRFQGYS